jgi:O-antigen/teichoic acid export membrane protein
VLVDLVVNSAAIAMVSYKTIVKTGLHSCHNVMAAHTPLIQNTFLYALGPLANRLLAIGLIPFYSYYLQASELGYYDLVVTMGSLAMAVVTLKVSDGVYRWLADSGGNHGAQQSAISNSLAILLAGMLLLAVVFLLLPQYALQYPGLVCGYVLSSMLFQHLQQILRGLGYLKQYAWLSLVNCLLLVAANLVFLLAMHYRLNGVLLSAIAANVVSIVVVLWLIRFGKYVHWPSVEWAVVKRMLAYSTPLVFNALNWWLMGGFDRILIAAYIGYTANGVYAVANKFASIMVLLNSFFIPAWQDFILDNAKRDVAKQHFNRYFNRYIVLQLSLMVFLSVAGKWGVRYFIDAQYATAWQYLPLLLAGTCLLAFTSFLGSFFLLKKDTASLFKTTLWGSLANIALSFLLIGPLGLYGPCVGMCAGFLVSFLLRYTQLQKAEGLAIQYRPVLLLAACFALVCFCLYSSFAYADVLAGALALAVLLLMNKGVIVAVLAAVKNRVGFKSNTISEEIT